jgi:hypothetical protein
MISPPLLKPPGERDVRLTVDKSQMILPANEARDDQGEIK